MKQIYVVNNKEAFVKTLKPLTNAKIMSLSEIESKVLGDYDNKARTYLYLEKHIDLNMIDVYLASLKYVDTKPFNEKITFLIELKKELINKNLYYYDDLFLNSLKNSKITFIDFIKNKHLDHLIKILENYTSVEFKELEIKPINQKIHEYRYIDDEVNDIIYRVMNLVHEGKSLNNIKLMNVDSSYYASLTRVLDQYHIPYLNMYDTKLSNINYGINFIKTLKEVGVKEAIKTLNNNDYDPLILSVINNYAYLDNIDDAQNFIIKDLNNKKINSVKRDVYLELVPLNYEPSKDDYVFFMNLNNGVAPRIYEDSDYLTNEEYESLNELTSDDKTFISEQTLLSVLSKVDYISYKLVGAFDSYLPSYIISKYGLEVVKETRKRHDSYYSEEIETYNYALSRDNYMKTRIKDEHFDFLNYNFKNNVKMKDYSFTGININKYHDYMKHELNLSYSKLSDFFGCKYEYYLKYILKINNYQNTLPTIRGNVFHKLLEEKDNEDFNYDEVFDKEINSFKETDNKIHFFSSLIKDEFNLVKEFNDGLVSSSALKDACEEYEVNINKQIDDMNVKIVGFIDRIQYNDDSIMLIDYKSGSVAQFHLDMLYYGLNLQLPMYAYYMKQDEKFKDKRIAGLYLEYIYHAFNKKELKDPLTCMKELKLKGYTNDLTIDSLSNDFATYFVKSNKLSNYTIDNMVKFTEGKIDEAINDIIDAKFDVDPKYMKNRHDSCQFCEFHDICHFNGKKRVLETKEVSDFLGGE